MKRRELVRAMAGTLTLLSTSSAFADAVVNYSGEIPVTALSKQQLNLLAQLVDCVIPTTDTPGAASAGVHHFINHMLANWYSQPEAERFRLGLTALEDAATSRYQVSLSNCSTTQKIDLLTSLEAQADESKAVTFVTWMKELTVMGYYTSEIGATQELRYLDIPGSYSGCIDFTAEHRTWAV